MEAEMRIGKRTQGSRSGGYDRALQRAVTTKPNEDHFLMFRFYAAKLELWDRKQSLGTRSS
jgi:hypothetical protein